MADWRMIIAFKNPPERLEFRPAKSGKSWFRRVESKERALLIAQSLTERDIHGVIKRCEPPRPYEPQRNGTLYKTRP